MRSPWVGCAISVARQQALYPIRSDLIQPLPNLIGSDLVRIDPIHPWTRFCVFNFGPGPQRHLCGPKSIIDGSVPNSPGALAHTKPTSFKFANKYLKWQEDYGAEFS